MTAKETIEIEALLYRAYAQYRVHKVSPAAVIGIAPLLASPSGFAATMAILQLGTRVDTSGAGAKAAGMQRMMAATPDDLLVVHDHVLALSDWLIEGAESAEPTVWRRDEIRENGWAVETRPDGLWLVRPSGPGGAGRGHLSRLADPHLCAMVIQHASNGTRPECRAVRDLQRRPAAEARELREERAHYAVWHAALAVLAAELNDQLTKHHVLPPSAPAQPWTRRALRDVPAGTPLPGGAANDAQAIDLHTEKAL
ncbi:MULTISPECIES: hypothetical protein [unclassified Bosea (in: a-proteobacteria)]|uniref:hypothetical protein n=1 Tax=unclassified Bosea (in: a-proteobacteria) TaxID=2653178 RepID=UPI000F754221|nr:MULTISPECIES: hypothetical protein [unclassified Bosea (in: a-proteobacteria)]AZO77729.1 hypothetical protein BLM15_08945 [Bosea sp. Tri-49]RXT18343.1 hypothetical protein B5U98_24100 [Bosea sp. Tri-39]RXT32939.1 hypothetical protein B5U99_30445 [Bosea sp. Tri-54]